MNPGRHAGASEAEVKATVKMTDGTRRKGNYECGVDTFSQHSARVQYAQHTECKTASPSAICTVYSQGVVWVGRPTT